jgi:metal-responsive CopG/Arc/MetJ family transcriptional regulator
MEVIRVMKINVSMPEDIIKMLDESARENNSSRSALLTLAAKRYLGDEKEKKERERRHQATKRIFKLAEEFGSWDGTAEIIKWRDRH